MTSAPGAGEAADPSSNETAQPAPFTIEQGGLLNLSSASDGRPILQVGRSDGYGYMQVQDADGKNTMYGPAYQSAGPLTC